MNSPFQQEGQDQATAQDDILGHLPQKRQVFQPPPRYHLCHLQDRHHPLHSLLIPNHF